MRLRSIFRPYCWGHHRGHRRRNKGFKLQIQVLVRMVEVPSSNASDGTKLSADWPTAMKVLLLSYKWTSVASTWCTYLFAKVHTVFQRRIILFYSKCGRPYVPPTLLSVELAPWIPLNFTMGHLQKPTRQIGHALIQKTMQNHHAHRNGRWFRHNRNKKRDLNDFIFRSCPVLFIPVPLESMGCFAILCSETSHRTKIQIQHCYRKQRVLFKILKTSLFLIFAPYVAMY